MLLENWNFGDKTSNSTLPQINRQESARNLFVQGFDPIAKRAVLYDPKREQTHTATLSTCDCVDFQRQKTVIRPCMHIYRVAAELGLITLNYMDYSVAALVDAKQAQRETTRLQSLSRDTTHWGDWAKEIHDSFVQKNRQWRAYAIVYGSAGLVEHRGQNWRINGWFPTLVECDCPDFAERQLPCKHIYAVAILSKIPLPLSQRHFQEAWDPGEELFFHAWGEARVKRQDPKEILSSVARSTSPETNGLIVRIPFGTT